MEWIVPPDPPTVFRPCITRACAVYICDCFCVPPFEVLKF
jgi:hypothetical protein